MANDFTSRFKAFKILPDKLHIVIGRTHTAESCSKTPDIILSYKTIPIKFPTDKYKGIKIMLIKIETLIELLILFSIEE